MPCGSTGCSQASPTPAWQRKQIPQLTGVGDTHFVPAMRAGATIVGRTPDAYAFLVLTMTP